MESTISPTQAVTITCPSCERRNRVDLTRVAQAPQCGACRGPLRLDQPVRATQDDLDDTLASATVPVLVDFYADWCGPCRATAPVVEALAAREAGRALVVKVDTDRNPGAATRYGVRGIPTFIAFREGREVRRHVGQAGATELARLLGDG